MEYTGTRVRIGNEIITEFPHEVEAIHNLDTRELEYHDLRRGDVLHFETTVETVETETRREYRHGFSGQEREVVLSRETEIVKTETRKLWHTSKRGWYWLEV